MSPTRKSVLLADDNFALSQIVARQLGEQFEIVGTVTTGPQLISEAVRLNPDLIIADITMPELNGIDAARKFRELGCCSALVYLTVHSEPEFIEACLAQGALGYVLKARMKSHLLPAIQAALSGQVYISPLQSGDERRR